MKIPINQLQTMVEIPLGVMCKLCLFAFLEDFKDSHLSYQFSIAPFKKKKTGADAEETILNAFKVFDPEGKGTLRKDL